MCATKWELEIVVLKYEVMGVSSMHVPSNPVVKNQR